ncbi:helix-turn-helix domain-containing protein [Pseudalkalibacillus sp. R45]|uniref:helix-turn-helix domain-containing protein n=1 Tax=Pseudalkalibacillus sp. R45 TaxID=3457433 RepID=UPI003FCE769B
MQLGDTIRRHREEMNISIEQLALNSRLSIHTLKRIENNELIPDRDMLFKLSTALDIPISEYRANPGMK